MFQDFDPARIQMLVARRKPYVNDQNQSITPLKKQHWWIWEHRNGAASLFHGFPRCFAITRNDSY